MTQWDERFINLAEHISAWSKDPSTKVGSVIVASDHRIRGLGFNGFPPGVADDGRLDVRELKYELIVHAEANALLHSGDVRGCTLYNYPLPPCSRCATMIITAGIKKVVAPRVTDAEQADRLGIFLGVAAMAEAGVEVELK